MAARRRLILEYSFANRLKNFEIFRECFNTGFLCDFSINVTHGGNLKAIKCHKLILAVGCSYFWTLFKAKDKLSHISLNGFTYETVSLIINYLYYSKVSISSKNSLEVIKLAKEWQIDDIVEKVKKFIQDGINDENQKETQKLFKDLGLNVNVAHVKTITHTGNSNSTYLHHHPKVKPRLRNQHLMCIGGEIAWNKRTDSVEISIDGGRSWKKGSNAAHKRSYFGAVSVGGAVYIVGGYGENGKKLKCCERYDIASNSWSEMPEIPDATTELGFSHIRNTLFVVGGCSEIVGKTKNTFSYDLEKCSFWKPMAPMVKARWGHVTCSINEFLFSIGGHGELACEKYNLSEDKWTMIAPMSYSRYDAGICTDEKNHIYIAGGQHNGTCLDSVEKYYVDRDEWRQVQMPTLQIARANTALTYNNGCLYIVGGRDSMSKKLNTVEEYDEETNSWSIVGKLSHGRYFHSAVSFESGCKYLPND